MDLFVNNSIFSEESKLNDFLNSSFIDFNKNAAVMVRRKNAVRLLSMVQWFTKCSAIEKSNYLIRLANELSLDDLTEVIKPIKLFFGKPFMLNEATNGTICVDDKVLNDDNINLAPNTLKEVQESDFRWFYNLERVDQVEVILGLTKILGVGSCRKVYQRLVGMYRVKHKVEFQLVADIAAEAAAAAENAAPAAVLLNHCGQVLDDDYADAGDVHLTVLNLRTNWAHLIARYHLEVFGKATSKQQQHKQMKIPAAEPYASSKSRKKQKHQTADNQRLDRLQLLPLYISWKILGYLDNKTLAAVQQVNMYWLFACVQVLDERAARIALGKTMGKMAARMLQLRSASSTLMSRWSERGNSNKSSGIGRRCELRLLQLFERGTAIPSLRRSAPPADSALASLLQDVLEQAHFPKGSFVLPTEGVRMFPRCCTTTPGYTELAAALFVGAECATQWLEGSPGRMVHRRLIAERQVAAAPLGCKVEAASTRQSIESLDDMYRAASAAAPPPTGSPDHKRDEANDNVLSDLASTTPMRMAARLSLAGAGGEQEPWLRPDAESVLRTFEQRISMPHIRMMPSLVDADANASMGFVPSSEPRNRQSPQ